MTVMQDALSTIKDNIEMKTLPIQVNKPPVNIYAKQYVNGYEVYWDYEEGSNKKVPYIANERFYIQYPSKPQDIQLPDGVSRVTYNSEKKQVEYYGVGDTLLRIARDPVYSPLPIPEYFARLTKVEETYDLDLDTGEIKSDMTIDILPEGVYWKLCLQEFEKNQIELGVSEKLIKYRIQKYLKNLFILRGVTINQLNAPIPKNIQDDISYAEMSVLKK